MKVEKEYYIKVTALNVRSMELLDKAFDGVDKGLRTTFKRIGLREDDYSLEVEL